MGRIDRATIMARQRTRDIRLAAATAIYERFLTRWAVVGYRRYRGAAAAAVARSRGITGRDSRDILSVPRYGYVRPPGGLAEFLARLDLGL